MALKDSIEYDGPDIADVATDLIWKNYDKNVHFFCWNCGKKLGIVPVCPHCGAMTSGKMRFLSPCAPQRVGRASAGHPSVRRYRSKALIGTIIFMILFSIGLSIFMFASGDLDFDDEGIHIMSMILSVLWIFWLLWLAVEYGGTGKKLRAAREYNRTPGNVQIVCGICGSYTDRRANYCDKCGCILPK